MTLGTVALQAPLSIGSPSKNPEWVAISSTKGSSQPRDRTLISCVSCIAGGFLLSEPPEKEFLPPKPAFKKRGVSQAISHQCVNDRPKVLAFVIDVFVTVDDSQM